jgi:hypothetical protein
VPFHRQLAEGRLEFGVVRTPLDLKGFVVTALGRHQSIPPERRFIPENASEIRLSLDQRPGLNKHDPVLRDALRTPWGAGAMVIPAV